jgi:hypothetical protein
VDPEWGLFAVHLPLALYRSYKHLIIKNGFITTDLLCIMAFNS